MIKQTITKNKGIEDHEFPGYQHHDGLWFGENEHKSYHNLAHKIYETYPNVKTILEIGSGAGSLSYWLRWFNKEYEIVTVDGNQQIIHSPYIKRENHFIIRTDQKYNISKNGKTIEFDLVLCYEHLEHIQKESLSVWLDMLNKHTHKGSIFLGSASTLHYNDRVHVTLEKKDWWNQQFRQVGWLDSPISVLNNETKPFNFEMENTSELTYEKV